MTRSPSIFISYRRDGSSAWAGRIRDRLMQTFDGNQIFMDVDGIAPGSDFSEVLSKRIDTADIFICVIGKGWAEFLKLDGSRRLDDPLDFVRIEVETALRNPKTHLIPVLVDGAKMPSEDQLPGPMKGLARRQGIELRHEKFAADTADLIRAMRKETVTPLLQPSPGTLSGETVELAGGVLLALSLGGISGLSAATMTVYFLMSALAAYIIEYFLQEAKKSRSIYAVLPSIMFAARAFKMLRGTLMYGSLVGFILMGIGA